MRLVLLASLGAACGFRGQAITGDATTQPADAPRAIDAPNPPPLDGTMPAPDAVPSPDAPAIDATMTLSCPTTANWVTLNNGGHYYFSPDGADRHWSAAESDCESRGFGFSPTHLAVIGTMQEAVAVGAHLPQVGASGVLYAWIGMFQPLLSPAKNANWLAVTGGAAYANWYGGEPSDGGNVTEMGKENFVQLYPAGDMNDTPGTDNLHYICECDGVFADATTLLLVPPGN